MFCPTVLRRCLLFFFSSRRRHTRYWRDWSSDVCSSDLLQAQVLHDLAPVEVGPDAVELLLGPQGGDALLELVHALGQGPGPGLVAGGAEIGRASCRERV